MHVIICGAGQVGSAIARHLVNEGNDVSVIDRDPERIARISQTLDVRAHIGCGSHPSTLHELGAESAEMLIAVTLSDEINMVACQVAHSLFNIETRIARIRHQSYLDPQWKDLYRQDHMPIDYIISPEIEVADAILNRMHVPGAAETIPFANDQLKVIAINCMLDCPVVRMPVRKIEQQGEELNMSVIGILREDIFFIPDEYEVLMPGDRIYITVETRFVQQAMSIFGHEEQEARRIVIVGGGNVGLYLAEHLEKELASANIKVIELSKTRAEEIVNYLDDATVLHGSALDQQILEEANIDRAETIIAVSNDDKVNILSSLLGKQLGAGRAVTLVIDSSSYSPLVASLGIDTTVNPREITVSSILQFIRKGRVHAAHSLCDGRVEVLEIEVSEHSAATGRAIGELSLPEGAKVGSIIRQQEVVLPTKDTVIKTHDHILVIAQAGIVKKVEKAFAVEFDFY